MYEPSFSHSLQRVRCFLLFTQFNKLTIANVRQREKEEFVNLTFYLNVLKILRFSGKKYRTKRSIYIYISHIHHRKGILFFLSCLACDMSSVDLLTNEDRREVLLLSSIKDCVLLRNWSRMSHARRTKKGGLENFDQTCRLSAMRLTFFFLVGLFIRRTKGTREKKKIFIFSSTCLSLAIVWREYRLRWVVTKWTEKSKRRKKNEREREKILKNGIN